MVPKQVTFIFSKMQKYERFNSLAHLGNLIFYNILMLLFGFVILNALNC
jgi:hypothetical protein